MERLSQAYGRAARRADAAGLPAAAGDDADHRRRRRRLRNAGLGGIPWSSEVSEDILYLMTLLAAPWLLRQGQHIRVDILLRAVPPRRRLAAGVGRRPSGACLLALLRLVRLDGAGRELPGRRDLHQDAGDAGMVDAGAAAGGVPAARHRVRLSHAPAGAGRTRAARRMRCRRHDGAHIMSRP